jgi:hypothetical protein
MVRIELLRSDILARAMRRHRSSLQAAGHMPDQSMHAGIPNVPDYAYDQLHSIKNIAGCTQIGQVAHTCK